MQDAGGRRSATRQSATRTYIPRRRAGSTIRRAGRPRARGIWNTACRGSGSASRRAAFYTRDMRRSLLNTKACFPRRVGPLPSSSGCYEENERSHVLLSRMQESREMTSVLRGSVLLNPDEYGPYCLPLHAGSDEARMIPDSESQSGCALYGKGPPIQAPGAGRGTSMSLRSPLSTARHHGRCQCGSLGANQRGRGGISNDAQQELTSSSRLGGQPPKKNPCLEMGGGGEADARPAFGRSARLGSLLVVVNHRAPPSAPMVGRVSGSSSARTRV